MQHLSQRPLPFSNHLLQENEICSFLSTNMEHTWDEFYFKRSFIGVVDKYVETVDKMESTILVPSRLMGLPMTDLLSQNNFDNDFLQKLDMRAFFAYMKAVKTQITLGSSYITEDDERNTPFQCKLREATKHVNQIILIAKYITIFAQNIAIQSGNLSYKEFENNVRFSQIPTLKRSLKEFLKEVDEMEKAVLFPCLLKDHGIVEDVPKFSNSASVVDNLHDVFTLLKQIKKEILSGPQNSQLPNEKLHEILAELYETLHIFTSLTDSLTERYKQEVQCM